MGELETDPSEVLRQHLQAELRAALKRRDAVDVSIIRSLIAAIDNAGAVPLAEAPAQSEVERRRLDSDDVEAILRREYEIYEAAAAEFMRLGRAEEADAAARGMAFVRLYLRPSD